mgnify:CR=1 FL=1
MVFCVDPEQTDQAIDARRCPGTSENNIILIVSATAVQNDLSRLSTQACHHLPAERRFGMTVCVDWQELLDHEVFDLAQRPARRDIIGVNQSVASIQTWHLDAFTDQPTGRSSRALKRSKWFTGAIDDAIFYPSMSFRGLMTHWMEVILHQIHSIL